MNYVNLVKTDFRHNVTEIWLHILEERLKYFTEQEVESKYFIVKPNLGQTSFSAQNLTETTFQSN